MTEDDRSRSFAGWSGYTPAAQDDHNLAPLTAEQLLAEADLLRREAKGCESRGDNDTAAVMRQAADSFDARAAELAE